MAIEAAAVLRAELDPDAVAQRQAADHEQAHPARHRDVHDGRVGQAPVGLDQLLGGHADAGVGDREHERRRPR